MEWIDGNGHHESTHPDAHWKFINKALHRPGERSDIDFVKWNRAQSWVIHRIVSTKLDHIISVACPEVQNLLHKDSTETGVVLLLGRMFAQCFYQYGIDEIIDDSEYAYLSHDQKLWVSNVVLWTESCNNDFILEIAHFVWNKLEKYLIENADRLMNKAAQKVEENFLGKTEK